MNSPLTWREGWRTALLLAVILVAANAQTLVGSELAPAADGPRLYYPFQHHAWSMLARGHLPTWSNFFGGGFPILASSQVVLFYPPNWIFGLFRSPVAYNVVTLLHVWIIGLGSYVLARRLGISRIGALVAALVMMFGASMAARIAAGHIGELYNRALMPWQLVAVHFLAQKPTWRRMLPLATVFGLSLLAGSSGYQIVMYSGIVSAVWGLYLLVTTLHGPDRWRFVLWSAVAVGVGISLSAVQTLPSADLLSHGNRQGGLSDEDLDVAALPIPMALGFVFPHTFDDATITDYIWPEFATYMGAGALFLALYALRRRRREGMIRFWGALILVFFLLSFGLQNPLYRVVLAIFPPYTLVRNPARHLAVVQLGLAMLAGFGLDTFLHAPHPDLSRSRIRWQALAAGLAALVVIGAAAYSIESDNSWDVFPERLLRGAIWFQAALLGGVLSLQLARTTGQRWAYGLLLGLLLVDLLAYAHPLFDGSRSPGHLDYLEADHFPDNPRYMVAFQEQEETTEWTRMLYAADGGVPILNVYSSVLPERAVTAANLLFGRPADTYLENHVEFIELARPDLLDAFGVRWVLVEPGEPPFDDPTLRDVRDEGVIRVLENTNALPLAFVVPAWDVVTGPDESSTWLEQPGTDYAARAVIEGDPPAEQECPEQADGAVPDSVTALRLEGGNIYLTVQTAGPRLLVVNQTYVDGWQAWIDGETTTAYPANHRALGVYVPCAGTHEVHLRYLPRSLQLGAALSLLTVAGMVLALGGAWVRQRAIRA
jgi:hypothetical protein